MKKVLFILYSLLLLSCEENKYKVETNKGETFIIKATGYNIHNNNVHFFNDKGYIENVKSIIVVE